MVIDLIKAFLFRLCAGVRYVELRTDSEFTVNCMTDWIRGWKANGWRASNGQPVVNREELEELDEISQKMKIRYVSANLQGTLPYLGCSLLVLFMTRNC
jgi:ribonuclease HI